MAQLPQSVGLALSAVMLMICSALALASDEKTYLPKSEEELEVLSLVLKSEIKANNWPRSNLLCFSVEGLDPSPKLVKALRQRGLNVCSIAEWRQKFNCVFEVRLQVVSPDLSQSVRVHTQVLDLRPDIAVIERDGEYLVRKNDGVWVVSDYVPAKQGTSTH
jgi:hypothetical protein